jgi:hypothetical protein
MTEVPMSALAAVAGLLLAHPDPLLAEVVAGHRANLERVRTMSAVFTVRSHQDGRPFPTHTFRYLRDPNGALLREGVEGQFLTEYALLPSEVRQLSRIWPPVGSKSNASVRVAAARMRDTSPATADDLWFALGGVFRGKDRRPHDLATVLAESNPPAKAVRENRDGTPLVKVTTHARSLTGSAHRTHWWFDPARGYILIRTESAMGDGNAWGERSELARYADGVWLPSRFVSETRVAHGFYQSETVVAEVSVNQPLPGGGTALPLPTGTEVKDELRGTTYRGNPDWTPAGPEKRWQQLSIPKPADPGPYTAATTAEPTGWTRWLLYAAGAVLAVGLIGLAARWLLSHRAEGTT